MNGTTTKPSAVALLPVVAAWCVCLAAHAQIPVPMDEQRKPSMPVQLPQFRQRPSVVTSSGAGDSARFLTVGKDAAIGTVASDAAPGDSAGMLALVVDGSAGAFTSEVVDSRLRRLGLPDATAEQLHRLFLALDQARYSVDASAARIESLQADAEAVEAVLKTWRPSR